jgi:hypothetical protein
MLIPRVIRRRSLDPLASCQGFCVSWFVNKVTIYVRSQSIKSSVRILLRYEADQIHFVTWSFVTVSVYISILWFVAIVLHFRLLIKSFQVQLGKLTSSPPLQHNLNNMILSNKVGILSALIALSALEATTGHGYMKTPRSRNYHANLNGKWSGGTASDPAPESCPHW